MCHLATLSSYLTSSSMEERRPRGSTDESAAVKAAAWAWYQHGSGSGSDGTPAREYDAARPRLVPRPSRYKLEAMRSKTREGVPLPLIDDNFNNKVSLLDAYEIQSISRHLDSLMYKYSSGDHGDDHKDDQDFRREDALISDTVDDDHSMVMEEEKKKNKSLRKMVNLRGFWIRHAVAMCGTRPGAVVETAAKSFWDGRRRRRQTEDSRRVLPVAMAATCRPWNSITHSRG